MDKFTIYIGLIFVIKLIFIGLSGFSVYVKHKQPINNELLTQLNFWKDRFEFIFIVLMSLLLLYLFQPHVNRLYMINSETKFLIYLFAVILLISAKWEIFFKESPLLRDIQQSVR